MNKNEHFVFILPGLGDRVNRMDLFTLTWPIKGLDRGIFSMEWYDNGKYIEKETELLRNIEKRKKTYEKVSIVGASAGGSAALNIMAVAPDLIYKAVDNCGRLRPGSDSGFRSFERRTATSSKFAESINVFTERENKLSSDQLRRILVIRPAYGDELVPADTCCLKGANNHEIKMLEHGITIAYALASNVISRFLLE